MIVVKAGSSGRRSQISPEGDVRWNATGPVMVRPVEVKAYGSVRHASLAICRRRSVGSWAIPTALAMSPEWIQVSASRVVAMDRADSSPVTHITRLDRSDWSSTSTSRFAVDHQRSTRFPLAEARARHHERHSLVDRRTAALKALSELCENFIETPQCAPDGHLVRLSQVKNDV